MHECREHLPTLAIDPGESCSICEELAAAKAAVAALREQVAKANQNNATLRLMAQAMLEACGEAQPGEVVHRSEPAPMDQVQAGLGGEPPKPPPDEDARETARLKVEIQALLDRLPESTRPAIFAEVGVKLAPGMPITSWRGRGKETRKLHEAASKAVAALAPVAPAPPIEPDDDDDGIENPAPRLTESAYIADLKLRYPMRVDLAKAYQGLIGHPPPMRMEPAEMRATMAADQKGKGIIDPDPDEDIGPTDDCDRDDPEAPPGNPPPDDDDIPY